MISDHFLAFTNSTIPTSKKMLWGNAAAIINRIAAFGERMATARTKVALASLAGLAMLTGRSILTNRTVHIHIGCIIGSASRSAEIN